MKDWPPLPDDEELERADALLDQADALLRRHRPAETHSSPSPEPPRPDEFAEPVALEDEDDLPILTDVVDVFELADLGVPEVADHSPPPAAEILPARVFEPPPPRVTGDAPPPAASPSEHGVGGEEARLSDEALLISARAALIEELVELDTEIARAVESWLATELPQIVSRELQALGERVQAEALAQLRATLLPALSERIAGRIDKLVT